MAATNVIQDLEKVTNVIHAWAAGKAVASSNLHHLPAMGDPPGAAHTSIMNELRNHPDHERIRSRSDPFALQRTWLTSSWVQIGVNIEGSKILVDYTVEHLDDSFIGNDTIAKEEIINHIQLAKELYPECSVWSPEAWRFFPLSESPRDLQFPF